MGQGSQGLGSHWERTCFELRGLWGGPPEKKLSFMLQLGNSTSLSLCVPPARQVLGWGQMATGAATPAVCLAPLTLSSSWPLQFIGIMYTPFTKSVWATLPAPGSNGQAPKSSLCQC